MGSQIHIPEDNLADFCKKNHICRLSFFGSIIQGDFGPDSDIDVLVEFEPGCVPGFFQLFDMEEELSLILGGRKIDMRTPQDLSRYFRDKVLRTSELRYAGK